MVEERPSLECLPSDNPQPGLYGPPEIFNSDQGCQFTSQAFIDVLEAHGVTIGMDGKGCYRDNIFVERRWHRVEHECACLTAFEDRGT